MYEAFYELKATPFTRGIPTDALYMPTELTEVLSRLNYVAQRQLFAVITGDCGTGKTTLLRKFSSGLNKDSFKFLYISDSNLTPRLFTRLYLNNWVFRQNIAVEPPRHNYTRKLK